MGPVPALLVLEEPGRVSEKVVPAVDATWPALAEAAALCFGVERPVRDSPGDAILALAELPRGEQANRAGE